MDLKAEIKKIFEFLEERIYLAALELEGSDNLYEEEFAKGKLAAFTLIRPDLLNLLKHEAFQTTEPCMTKEGMSAE